MLGAPLFGDFSPVAQATTRDWRSVQRYRSSADLVVLGDKQLAELDPAATSLLVAREMPEVQGLDVPRYQRIINRWADEFQRTCLPRWEREFR